MDSLIQHIYVSHAASTFQEHQIPELLKQIRPENAKHAITGLLIYTGTAFLQVLEGERSYVNEVFERIARDRRHIRVTTIVHEPLARRLFPDWTMDFVNVHPIDADETVGGPGFLTGAPDTPPDVAAVRRLVTAARKPSWQSEDRAIHQTRRAAGGNDMF